MSTCWVFVLLKGFLLTLNKKPFFFPWIFIAVSHNIPGNGAHMDTTFWEFLDNLNLTNCFTIYYMQLRTRFLSWYQVLDAQKVNFCWLSVLYNNIILCSDLACACLVLCCWLLHVANHSFSSLSSAYIDIFATANNLVSNLHPALSVLLGYGPFHSPLVK